MCGPFAPSARHQSSIALQRCKAGRFAYRKIPMFCNVRVSFPSFRRVNVINESVSMIVKERLIKRLPIRRFYYQHNSLCHK